MVSSHDFSSACQSQVDVVADVFFAQQLVVDVGVLTLVGTDEGEIFAVLSDQEADEIDSRNNDRAVGAAATANLAEVDVAGLVRVVGDDEDVVLASLSASRNHAVLGGLSRVAAADDLV